MSYILRKSQDSINFIQSNALAAAPGGYPGRTYYVNNITGLSGNDGLSWDNAMDEVSTAITAAEAYRATFLPTTNQYIRNRIFVQATGTGYTAITALPLHCDIIGVGDVPYGNGAGIAVIGTTTGTAVTSQSATVRGCNFYNIQFSFGAAATCGVDLVGSFLRGAFVNCSFLCAGTTSTGSCLNIQSNFAGNLVQHCQMTGDSGYPAYGIYFTASKTMNNNIIEDCIIGGTTCGIYIGASVNDVNTVFRNNFIGNSLANDSAKAVDDNGPGYGFFVNNYIVGTDAVESAVSSVNFVANHVINSGTAAVELAEVQGEEST
jgi:hypothetical protein